MSAAGQAARGRGGESVSRECLVTPSLPSVHLLAGGMVGSSGRGLEALAATLATGQPPMPVIRPAPWAGVPVPCLCVPEAALSVAELRRGARRADRFCRMAMAAADEAWSGALTVAGPCDPARVGLLVATGLGPHVRTFGFLDGVLDFGDGAASPTDFSHSVHNAAAAYVAGQLGIQGPTLTVTDFAGCFARALLLAQCWLAERVCERVVMVAVEEIGEVMLHVLARLWAGAEMPVVGEGAVGLVLTADPDGELQLAAAWPADGQADHADLRLVDAPLALPPTEPPQSLSLDSATGMVVDAAAFLGRSLVADAFNLMTGMLCLSNPQVHAAFPRLAAATGQLRHVAVVRSSTVNAPVIHLRKIGAGDRRP